MEGVTVPTVKADKVYCKRYIRPTTKPLNACVSVPVPSAFFTTVFDEYVQPVPKVQPVADPVKVPFVTTSLPKVDPAPTPSLGLMR